MTTTAQLNELLDRLERVRDGERLVIQTSGSTEAPKRVALSWSALEASARASEQLSGACHWLLTLPTEYVSGVMVAVRAIVSGTSVSALDSAPFAEALAGVPEPRAVSLVPNQLERLLDDADSIRALASCAVVLVGGQALPAALRERAEAARVPIVETYGSTETAGGCVWDGRPLPGVRVRIDEDERLWVSGPMLADGYLDEHGTLDETRTAGTFVESEGARWVRMDDRARLRDEPAGQRVEILGRADSMLISGGLKLDVAEVQRALDAGLLGRRCVALAVPGTRWGESLGLYLVDGPELGEGTEREIAAALVSRFGVAASPIIAHGPALELPNGKADLGAMRAAVTERARELGRLASMDGDE